MTKARKILEFIQSKGEEGASLKEIQEFVYFELNGAPLGESWFYKKDDIWVELNGEWKRKFGKGPRKSRGYYCTAIYGSYQYRGLLSYCKRSKINKQKWVLNKMPTKACECCGRKAEPIYKKNPWGW